MGMYTELVLKCQIKVDAPVDVKAIIAHMFRGEKEPEKLPQHKFFSLPRWNFIGSCSSFYHHPEVINSCPKFISPILNIFLVVAILKIMMVRLNNLSIG